MDNRQKLLLSNAIKYFWDTKQKQLLTSIDQSRRGAVLGGKQMDGFIELLKTVAIEMGVPSNCIFTSNTYLPGYFRASKNWDFLVITPRKELVAVVELKSQVGSYGNNFNNRTEEAIGSAVDLWTAVRDNQMECSVPLWVGYLMVVGKDKKSVAPVKNQEPHYSVLQEFKNASYIDRYSILCRKLVKERHYTSVALLWTENEDSYGDVLADISFERFINSYIGHIYGCLSEFK